MRWRLEFPDGLCGLALLSVSPSYEETPWQNKSDCTKRLYRQGYAGIAGDVRALG